MAKFVSHEIRNNFFHKQRISSANKICFDCNRRSPMWATVSFGVYMCLDCSGYHRKLGVHVSFVRSTDMDEWTEEQLLTMQMGGNNEARQFFKQHGVTDMMNIDEKYKTKASQMYKAQLAKKIQNPSFDPTPFMSTEQETIAAPTGGADGLDVLAKMVVNNPSAAATTGHFQRSTSPVGPSTISDASASTNPPPAPTQSSDSGLLQISRPMVTLGGGSSDNSIGYLKSSSTKPSGRKTGGATKLKSTRLGATKLRSDFDFDNVPFENAKPAVSVDETTDLNKQIEDDEALARAIENAEREEAAVSGGLSSMSIQNQSFNPSQAPEPAAQDSLNKYKNSKSISSDNFFAAEQVDADHDKIRQFSGAQSISSDAYYGNGRNRSASAEAADEAAYQLQLLKSQVSDKAHKLKNMTSNFFSDLQNRYS